MGSQSLRPRKTPSRWFRGPIAPVDPREDEDAGFVLSMHGKPKRHFLIGKGAMLPIPPELKSARPLQMHRLASTVDK